MSWLDYGRRTRADDLRDRAAPPDPKEHAHFHEHDGQGRHAHRHSHAEPGYEHGHSTQTVGQMGAHDEG